MKFTLLDGVKLLRWKYTQDLQDVNANIKMLEKDGLPAFFLLKVLSTTAEEKLLILYEVKRQLEEFLKMTE